MKQITKFVIFSIFASLIIFQFNNVNAKETVFTATEIIDINETTQITVSMAAPLTWEINTGINISVSIKLSQIAQNDSLFITYIKTEYNIPGKQFPENQQISIIEDNLTYIGEEFNINQTRYAPENTDEFNITLSILAQTVNMTNTEEFSMDFPGKGEDNIIIKKNLVIPVINLPGFPNIETFSRWIIIFIVIQLIIMSPAILVLYFKISKQKTRSQRKKKRRGENE
ncbi:MAG: hypothetical protein K9W46_06990 [Candidatus Heimdallarchaeum endolithica]|uniref:Uncharacterized protein n=1 Tax=Candidatus Heimdallarchaeum endolithica TaxID=2876572 RepID=A0A9Y1BTM8_9ARCH|nr:MAG: hypothetical protein K9W46_06990 [Candidatus Heimdallarchaeum endolithica]